MQYADVTHGTDAPAYALTQAIRLEANRIFRQAIGLARSGTPFRKDERILDVGCGQRDFFERLWADNRDVHVTGIDCDKSVIDWVDASARRNLRKGNFYDADFAEEEFDIIHASFAMTWLTGPADQSSGAPKNLAKFFSRAKSLLKNGGWLLAHHPGDEDYFPDFNKIIIRCVAKRLKQNEEAVHAEYFTQRRQRVASPSLALLRREAEQNGLHVHLLAKSLEWIPIKAEYLIPYWESGGKKPFESWLTKCFGSYDNFSQEFQALLDDGFTLKQLGITSFTRSGEPFFLLPAWHQYFIAELASEPSLTVAAPSLSWTSIESPIQAHAFARHVPLHPGCETGWLEQGAQSVIAAYNNGDADLAYVSLVDALKDKPQVHSYFSTQYKNKRQWVGKGLDWKLRTFTGSLRSFLKEDPLNSRSPISIVGVTNDDSVQTIKLLLDEQPIATGDGEVLRYCFCWQNGTLAGDQARNVSTASEDSLGTDLVQICDQFTKGWPRLFMTSDDAVMALKYMLGSAGQSSTYFEPLRYFDWQTRITAPYPNSFVLATTLVRGTDGDPEKLPSLFAMVGRPVSPILSPSQHLLQDTLIAQVLSALGTGVMARTMTDALSELEEEQMELRKSEQMLMKLQRPLDILTKAFSSVQAEAQEMQSILNDPEVALFATHKTLTEIFIEGREVRVTDTIRCAMRHEYWVQAGNDARIAYAYAICRVFGCHSGLEHCQNVDSVEATAQQLLERIERDAVHSDLLRVLAELVLPETVKGNDRRALGALRGSLQLLSSEEDGQDIKRKGKALDLWLKPVVFTPFKSFSSGWPKVAFLVAFYGKLFQREKLEAHQKPDEVAYTIPRLDVHAAHTPFPQSAILDFIINFCSLRDPKRTGKYWPRLSFDASANHAEVRLHYRAGSGMNAKPYRHIDATGEPTQLTQFLKHAIRYSGKLGNCGDFLNVFGSLIRKGLGLATGDPASGEWVLVDITDPEQQMLVLGRVTGEISESGKPKCDRFFEIYQMHENLATNEGKIILRWADSLAAPDAKCLKSPTGERQADASSETQTPPLAVPVENFFQERTPFIWSMFDHDAKRTGFDQQLKDALGTWGHFVVFQPELYAKMDVLFLHMPSPSDLGVSYLQARAQINKPAIVILLSTDPSVLSNRRDTFREDLRSQVFILQNPENLPLNTDALKRGIFQILELLRE